MKFLIAENRVVNITKKEAQEAGFLKHKPVYAYIVPKECVEEEEKLFFVSERGKLTENFEKAKRVKNFWKDIIKFQFLHFGPMDCFPAEFVNITPYLEVLAEVKNEEI